MLLPLSLNTTLKIYIVNKKQGGNTILIRVFNFTEVRFGICKKSVNLLKFTTSLIPKS